MQAQISASSGSSGRSSRQAGAAPSMRSAGGCTTSARCRPFLRGTGDTGGSGVCAACLGKIASAARAGPTSARALPRCMRASAIESRPDRKPRHASWAHRRPARGLKRPWTPPGVAGPGLCCWPAQQARLTRVESCRCPRCCCCCCCCLSARRYPLGMSCSTALGAPPQPLLHCWGLRPCSCPGACCRADMFLSGLRASLSLAGPRQCRAQNMAKVTRSRKHHNPGKSSHPSIDRSCLPMLKWCTAGQGVATVVLLPWTARDTPLAVN